MTQKRVVDAFSCHDEAKKREIPPNSERCLEPSALRLVDAEVSSGSLQVEAGAAAVNLNVKTKTRRRRGAADIWDMVH